jgi:microcystin-dependent protein
MFAGNFAPRGWAFCNGQLLPISQNTALFALIGTVYGGDGRTTMALPDMQGRAPMHPGQGPGLSARSLGQTGGVETVTLLEAQMPNHNHVLSADTAPANNRTPAGNSLARATGGLAYGAASNLVPMASEALPLTGGSQPHNNMQPFLTMSFIIALQGLFPSRG